MQAKTQKESKMELVVIGIALIAFVVGLVGHLAGASFANFDTFGYIEIDHQKAIQTFFEKDKDLMLLAIGESIAL